MERKGTKMWNDRKNEELHLLPMALVLAIALAALLIIGNVRHEARAAGEEIPQTGSAGRTSRAVVQNDEPSVYLLVEPRLLSA
jgi:hypothetical protein